MSEISYLQNRISQLEDEIRKLEKERSNGEELIEDVTIKKNRNLEEMQRRRNTVRRIDDLRSSAPYADTVISRLLDVYNDNRGGELDSNAQDIINKAHDRINAINYEIQCKRDEIASCYARIEAIRAEEERERNEQSKA
ncbi:MAG: hypothetical protein E7272_06245 [Pseudobutyrivibrio ruminis]|uniref:DUF5082 domain-containing protein n=3 Tax=Pseudobutyrivibrio TaxID=46205 RepID=A0A927U972_9FIRM|nr:hypothetical protein [Pseudobutyrivibrio ruminis]